MVFDPRYRFGHTLFSKEYADVGGEEQVKV